MRWLKVIVLLGLFLIVMQLILTQAEKISCALLEQQQKATEEIDNDYSKHN